MSAVKSGLGPDTLRFLEKIIGSDAFEVIPLAGDASTRKYYRLVHKDSSWVLMSWEPFTNPEAFPFLNVLKFFQAFHVQVPEVIDYAPELGQVVLEDLGDLTLERKFWENQSQELIIPFYQQAVDELIKIHFATRHSPSNACVALQIAFDTKKFMWELNYGREHLLEGLAGLKLSEGELSSLDKVFHDICIRLDQEKKFIAHRDYHSRNLMLKLGRTRVIDFQDARLGPVQYDLVSLLYDSYVALSPEIRGQILNYYLLQAQENLGPSFSRDHFDDILRVQIIQRCFKACGSFASFFNARQDRRYLRYIQPTLTTVAHTLESYPEYKFFLELIRQRGLLQKDYTEV